MTTWKSFQTRALSAIVALALIIALYVFLNITGLKIAVVAVVAIGTWELMGILFQREKSALLKLIFYVLSFLVFALSILNPALSGLSLSLAFILFVIASLLALHKTGDLTHIANFQAKAVMGFFYMGLLPSFAFRILDYNQGLSWFVFLLAAVFAGDTMAYVFGVLIGKHKVMPSVSPKKTWQGSIGGIIGSVAAGLICWLLMFPEHSLLPLLALAGVAGFVGQFGDFFESLLKRVANVKDSGKIMPGHGGVLDRIDGVLFASPVVLGGILWMSHLLS